MNDGHWIDLSALTLPELEVLAGDVQAEMSRQRLNHERWRQALHGKALRERGPRYRNPRNSSETWSGRGPEPKWVKHERIHGRSLDSLRA